MEREQNSEIYIPFAKSHLEETAAYLRKKTAPAGEYKMLSQSEKIVNEFFPRLVEGVEKFIGPIYSISDGVSNIIPQKWWPILNYLKEKKVISEINPGSFYCDTPKFVGFTVKGREKLVVMDGDGKVIERGISSYGAAYDDVDLALAKTIGETLERSQIDSGDKDKMEKYSINDLEKKGRYFLSPLVVVGYSAKQKEAYPKLKYGKDNVFHWSTGRSLFTGKKILLPAQLIFWNYTANKMGEPFLREPNTNGAGGHCTLNKAILSGLYELIQRDGFLIYWLNSLSPKRIEVDFPHSKKLENLLAQCLDFNFEVVFLDIATDLEVPTCACVLLDNSGIGPKVTVGMGCGAEWEDVMLNSLLEALGIYISMRSKIEVKNEKNEKCLRLEENYIPFGDKRVGQYDRLEVWADEKMFEKFKFFIQGKSVSLRELVERQKRFSSPEVELESLIQKFKVLGKDYEIFYFQVRNEILDKLQYSVVRIIVPALMPIYLNEVNITMNSSRLKDVPPKIGFLAAEKLNPWPHPFI